MKYFRKFLPFIYWQLIFILLPVVAFADPPSSSPPKIPNPLAGGVDDFGMLVLIILEKLVLPIGAIIVVFYIIYAGYLFVTAGGNEEKIETAKKTFLWVVVGAAVLLGSVAIALVVEETLKEVTTGVFPK